MVVSSESSMFHPVVSLLFSEGIIFSDQSFDKAAKHSFKIGDPDAPDVVICDLLVASPNDVLRAVLLKSKAELIGISTIFISSDNITVSQLGDVRTFNLSRTRPDNLLEKLCALDRSHDLSAAGQLV